MPPRERPEVPERAAEAGAARPGAARTDANLRATIARVDGRPYSAYTDLLGEFGFPGFQLMVDHVQADPFAPSSRLRVRVDLESSGIPADLISTPARKVAVADFIARACATTLRAAAGADREPALNVDHGEQEVLARSSCMIGEDYVEVRLRANLPAEARMIVGDEAAGLFFDQLPKMVEAGLRYSALSHLGIRRHVEDVEDQQALRSQLAERRLVAFVGDGAVLPRSSGISQKPLGGPELVPFQSPPELRVELSAPNRGKVTGMGIPEGVTLVVGGGFHGKSTLLAAIARAVYDHVPGDGRETVVTRADALCVRPEPGRPVERANIHAFIDNLPFGKDTSAFTTENASGSTSMAANIAEGLEAGASLLIVDEDTAATNFLVRDARMQRLVPNADEPITPFVDVVRPLYEEHRVSTILAIGGCGDYLDVADTVIRMREYRPELVTSQAREVSRDLPSQREHEGPRRLGPITKRSAAAESIDPQRRGKTRVRARGRDTIEYGATTIDLSALEQLVDPGQARAIADLIVYCWHRRYFEEDAALTDALARGLADATRRGLDVLAPHGESGDYAMPRLHEAAAALDRLRGLRVKQIGG